MSSDSGSGFWQEASSDAGSPSDSDSSERRAHNVALEAMAAELDALEREVEGSDDDESESGSEYLPADGDEDGPLVVDPLGLMDADDDELSSSEEEDEDEDEDEDSDEIFLDGDEEMIEDDGEGAGDAEQEAGETHTITLDELLSVLHTRRTGGTVDESGPNGRARAHLASLGANGLLRLLTTAMRGGRYQEEEEDEDDDDDYGYGGSSSRSPLEGFWDPCLKPIQAGQELRRGGDFGRPDELPELPDARCSAFERSKNAATRIMDRASRQRVVSKAEFKRYVPNTNGTEVARYPARVYCGQYSDDSSFFYTCDQDFKVHIYDTTVTPHRHAKMHTQGGGGRMRFRNSEETHETSLKVIKTINGRQGQWTITDAHLSPDNQWMIYSSITPYVYLVPTRTDADGGANDRQVLLDFSGGSDDSGVRYHSRQAIWSIRFSGDSREIVAGANQGTISVFDVEARKRVLRIQGHHDDVNAVAFADAGSSNVLLSGSDDSFVKVWDRRSLSGGKPAGVLPGHTEGVTYVSPKGDGRYCISNAKDQSVKLWDLRSLVSSSDFERDPTNRMDVGLTHWDYRNATYRKPRFQQRPNDCSVMTYRGHAVLQTLIRCHFSPAATTGQQYIYSGSADGRIHIWSLDGRVVQILDRNKTTPMYEPGSSAAGGNGPLAADPSAPVNSVREEASAGQRSAQGRRYMGYGRGPAGSTVRDVSWHSSEPSLMSTSWEPTGGSIAKHEWKAWGVNGLNFEDALEATRLAASAR